MRKSLLTLFVIGFLLSEIIFFISSEFAFVYYILLIGGCLVLLSRIDDFDSELKILSILMIFPMIRIAELFLDFGVFWNFFVLYSLLCFLVIFYLVKFKINLGSPRRFLILLPLMIIFGIIFGSLGSGLFLFEKNILFVFVLPLIVFSEEVLFRGMIQNLIQKENGVLASVFFPSVFYVIFCLGFGVNMILFFFLVSIINSLVYYLTRNIYLSFGFSLGLHVFMLVL